MSTVPKFTRKICAAKYGFELREVSVADLEFEALRTCEIPIPGKSWAPLSVDGQRYQVLLELIRAWAEEEDDHGPASIALHRIVRASFHNPSRKDVEEDEGDGGSEFRLGPTPVILDGDGPPHDAATATGMYDKDDG